MFETKTVFEAVTDLFTGNLLRNVLVAYSGGPDSGALLHAVCAFRDRSDELGVLACWVNHALRSEAEMVLEQKLAEAYAASLAVPLVIATAQPGAIEALASGKAGGVEAAARQFRYDELQRVCRERGCDCILTAHTLDDNVETLVMRFFSGSGAEGLAGIPSEQGLVLRPLLCTSKAQVMDYIQAHQLPYSEDSTNAQTVFLRNKVRHLLLPVVEEVFPQYRQALGTLQAKAKLDKEALTAYARLLFEGAEQTEIRLASFAASPEAVQIRALYLLVRKHGGRFPWTAIRLAVSHLKRGLNAFLGDLELYPEGGFIRLRKKENPPCPVVFSVLVSEACKVDLGSGLTLCVDFVRTDEAIAGLREDACALPFVVRSVRPGDSILSADGHKRLESIRQEWKLPESLKNLVFVVEDCDGIAAVWGSHIGKGIVFRHNPNLAKSHGNGYITIEMKGVHTE